VKELYTFSCGETLRFCSSAAMCSNLRGLWQYAVVDINRKTFWRQMARLKLTVMILPLQRTGCKETGAGRTRRIGLDRSDERGAANLS